MPFPCQQADLRLGVPNLKHCDVPASTNALGHTHSYPAMHMARRLQVGRTGLSIPLGKLGCAVSTEQNQAQGGWQTSAVVLFLSRELVTDTDLAFLK